MHVVDGRCLSGLSTPPVGKPRQSGPNTVDGARDTCQPLMTWRVYNSMGA